MTDRDLAQRDGIHPDVMEAYMSDPEQRELTDDQRLAIDNFWKYQDAWKALRAVNMALYQDSPNRSVPEDTEVLFSQCMERIAELRKGEV